MRIEQAAPVLLSSDLERTAAWYRDALRWEFDFFGQPPNFGIASRDGQRIMYGRSAEPFLPNWRLLENMWNVYIRVDDVDAWHAELTGRGVELDYGLGDQPWGMREFGVQDPDGHDIAFGAPVA
ncbi:MAG TPA: VOC family protein [Gaiellaceae bacterium]|nr:VOC family protein [Gaiellaceae bacterium]